MGTINAWSTHLKRLSIGIDEIIQKGTSYGVPTQIEVEMAKMIVEAYPALIKFAWLTRERKRR